MNPSRRRLLFVGIPLGAVAVAAAALAWRSVPSLIVPQLPGGSFPQIMQGIYDAQEAGYAPQGYAVRAAIVPHHLTAAQSIAAGIRMLGNDRRTIVLLSPDHFGACPTLLCTTRSSFRSPLGMVAADCAAIQTLLASPLVTEDASLFRGEHGIGAVLPFVAHAQSGVSVIPLVLSQKIPWKGERDSIKSLLRSLLARGAVLVISSDFSHYLPLAEADRMDEETATTFLAGDLDGIRDLRNPAQSDCPGCLWLLSSLAQEGGFFNPSVLLHTNSARILDDPAIPETTSHFAMVFYGNAPLADTDIAFGGDVTVTRGLFRPALKPPLREFWSGPGPRVLNLEGPLLASCTSSENVFVFCNVLDTWRRIRGLASHWGTVNNHMFDQGWEGYGETLRLVAAEGKVPLGTGAILLGNGVRIHTMTRLMNPVEAVGRGWVSEQSQAVLASLRRSHDERMDVVYVHDGEEYHAVAPERMRQELRGFVDAGADAVIAVHSHVVGDMEIYRGKPIFHGIGNFLFDQYAETATLTAKAVRLRMGEEGKVLFETLTVKQ